MMASARKNKKGGKKGSKNIAPKEPRLTFSGDMPCRAMIMVEYAAFKKTDHTVWSAITFGMKFHHAPSKSWAQTRQTSRASGGKRLSEHVPSRVLARQDTVRSTRVPGGSSVKPQHPQCLYLLLIVRPCY